MKLILNTAYGISILLYDIKGNTIIYEYQDLNLVADDINSVLKNIDWKLVTSIVFIDGPGSQISTKVGLACIKPILLIYNDISYFKFTYFEVMMLYINSLNIDWNQILLVIGVSQYRFYCAHVSKYLDCIKNITSSAIKGLSGNTVIDNIKDDYKPMLNFGYYKTLSCIVNDVIKLVSNDTDILLCGHSIFADQSRYIKNIFPLNLNQLKVIFDSLDTKDYI
ncbi:MAG: hypothetical protein AAFO15_00735 [Pseudomonadota bacterium]